MQASEVRGPGYGVRGCRPAPALPSPRPYLIGAAAIHELTPSRPTSRAAETKMTEVRNWETDTETRKKLIVNKGSQFGYLNFDIYIHNRHYRLLVSLLYS